MSTRMEKRRRFGMRLMDQLYERSHKELRDELDLLIEKNSAAHGNKSYVMVSFGNTYYSNAMASRHLGPTTQNLTHPSMRKEVREWHDRKLKLEEEKNFVFTYIMAALSTAKQRQHLEQLIPECFHHLFHILELDSPQNWGTGDDAHSMEEFIEKNSSYLAMMRRRLVVNLIESN